MQKKFGEVYRPGDLVVVVMENGTLFVGDHVEETGAGWYRVGFQFMEDGKIFESALGCREGEIKQVVRGPVTVWYNRG